MTDPWGLPVLSVRLALPDGSTLERDLTMRDLQRDGGHPIEWMVRKGPPDWLEDPRREWPAGGPIVFSGRVKPGRENDARAVMAS